MTTFDWHIVRRLVAGFVFFVLALILFFIVLHYVEYSDDFADQGATFRQIFLVYYPNYIPEIVRLISPLAIFLSCVYLTGKLAQELQLTALQTSGVSLYRLMVPYLAVGLVLAGFMFWFNGWVVPRTNETVLAYDRKYLSGSARQFDTSDLFRQNQPGQILAVGFYDDQDSVAHRVSLQQFSTDDRLVSRTDARRMRWIDSLEVWRLYDAIERSFAEGQLQESRVMSRLDTALYIYPHDLARTGSDVGAMTIPVASDYVASLRRSGASGLGRPLVAYYTKFTYPLANFLLVLIGVPLAATRRRGGQAVRFGLALFTAFAYLSIQKLAEPFGYAGELSPLLTAWLPHAAFAVVAVVLLLRVRK